MHMKCTEIESRNVELMSENEALKEKVSDLAFETMLLRDITGYDEEGKKDELIASLKQNFEEKDAESALLKATVIEKDSEIENSRLRSMLPHSRLILKICWRIWTKHLLRRMVRLMRLLKSHPKKG